MEAKTICLSHLCIAENAALQLQHHLPICHIVPVAAAAHSLECDISQLEATLAAKRRDRNQACDLKCTVCGRPGFLLSFTTFKTFCEECYPDVPTCTVTLSGLTSDQHTEVLQLLADLYYKEFNVKVPSTNLAEIQRAICRAQPLKSDFSCNDCHRDLIPATLHVTARHRCGSFHYCVDCFCLKNTASMLSGAFVADGLSSMPFMSARTSAVFSRLMTAEFLPESGRSLGTAEIQSSHAVRWESLRLKTRGEVRSLTINTWPASFVMHRESEEMLRLTFDYEVQVQASTPLMLVFDTSEDMETAASLAIGTDGTVWSQRGGIVASLDYYCFRSIS